MAATTSDIAGQLGAFFLSRGCAISQVGLLQPADPFLDIAGEDFRRRMFLTSDQSGANLCLRPEFTIPVCQCHLALDSGPARYGYAGTVFRQREDEAHEFTQAGIEDLGNENRVAADIACIWDADAALRHAGATDLSILLGDQAVFKALLLALGLPKTWREKLGREFGDRDRLRQSLASLAGARENPYANLPADLVEFIGADDAEAIAGWITEQMRQSGLPLTGGRTAKAIATRLMDKVELASVHLSEEKRQALEQFLAIDVPVEQANAALMDFESGNGLNLGPSLDTLKARFDGLVECGLGAGSVRYRAAFGRRLDYYTGLVFEIYAPAADQSDEEAKPLAGGGRYDRLMTMLGAEGTVPAVGFSIWVDRIERAVGLS